MALQTNTQIFIGGKLIKTFKEFTLEQNIDAHHSFKLICRMDALEALIGELASETRNFLGETLIIQVSSIVNLSRYKQLEFKGVVTNVNNLKGFHAQDGDIVVIQGYSCSIITDDGPHYESHSDINLTEILEKNFQGYDRSKLETKFTPNYSDTIHYSVQANESSFRYASRLAAQYGQWFYYDGKALVFGTPENNDPIPLIYGHDLQQFSMNLKPSSNHYNYFTNDYLIDEHYNAATSQVNSDLNGFNSFVSKKSTEIFAKETNVYVNSYNDPNLRRRLDSHVEQQKKATDIKQVVIAGVSDNPGVCIGGTIAIRGDATDYGVYRVIKVIHTNTENGEYQNKFEAVTAEGNIYPNANIHAYPKSDTQVATVVENSDPNSMGRIRVQFPWQKPMGGMTPWIRIVTPHAGGEKGFHFIPELGEEVLVGFENGNAEHPYVLGALYNGTKKPSNWRTQNNDIKAIRTRSGHTLEFNDIRNSERITITDKKGNHIVIDTAGETISINALKDINITAGENITMTAGKNINISAGEMMAQGAGENISIVANKDMLLSASGDMRETSNNRQDIIDTNFSRQSNISDEYAKEISLFSAEENMTMQSTKSVRINSSEKSKLF
ncbi:type VI secretion system Vgr family protein [Aquimarina longa]|uniref:type VI secretion system Vgr family protein n=1 Tax=Aquimarina longa TaxID=1080221 RepID=UPI000783166F|nr:phage baseplate assembly protein V [Aquimarina longa]